MMTTTDEAALEAQVCGLRAYLLSNLCVAVNYLTVDEVLGMVAAAYRNLPAGTVVGRAGRELAEEIEVAAEFMMAKYGI